MKTKRARKLWTKTTDAILVDMAGDLVAATKRLDRTMVACKRRLTILVGPKHTATRWTAAEDEILLRHKDNLHKAAALIPTHTLAACKRRLHYKGIKRTPWTAEQDAELLGLIKDKPQREVARILGRTERQVQHRCQVLKTGRRFDGWQWNASKRIDDGYSDVPWHIRISCRDQSIPWVKERGK